MAPDAARCTARYDTPAVTAIRSEAARASCGSEKVICLGLPGLKPAALTAGNRTGRSVSSAATSSEGPGFSRRILVNPRQNPRPQIRCRRTIAIRSRGDGHEMQLLQHVAAGLALREVRRAVRVFGW